MRRMAWVVVAVLLLAAPAWAGTTIKFYYPVHLTGPLVKEVEAIVAEFHKAKPEIKVEPVWGGTYPENMQKTVAAIQAGSPPDVAIHLAVDLITLRDMDAVIPLDDYVQRDGGSEKVTRRLHPGLRVGPACRGQGLGPPLPAQHPHPLHQQGAVPEGRPGSRQAAHDLDELLAAAQKATVRNPQGQVTTWGLTIPDDIWLLMCFIYQNGGRTSSPDFKKVYLAEQEAIGAVQFWADMANKHKVMPRHRTFPQGVQDFAAGNTAMLIHSTGNLRFVNDSAKFEWGDAFLPKNKKQAVPIGGAGFYIFKKAPKEKQDAAWEFAKFPPPRRRCRPAGTSAQATSPRESRPSTCPS